MYNLRYYSTLQSDIQFTIHDLRLTTVSLQSDSRFKINYGKFTKRFTIDYDSRYLINLDSKPNLPKHKNNTQIQFQFQTIILIDVPTVVDVLIDVQNSSQ